MRRKRKTFARISKKRTRRKRQERVLEKERGREVIEETTDLAQLQLLVVEQIALAIA